MNDNSYVYIITALLPLSALMLVIQVNPYNALVVQGILGSVAALVFAVLGAADVALTQALMGTLLAITLYAIAVRSSMVMRLGVLQNESSEIDGQFMDELRTIIGKYYMRLELVPYIDTLDLQRALMDKEIHATCVPQWPSPQSDQDHAPVYHIATRVRRLNEIMQAKLSPPATIVTYVNTLDLKEVHV